MWSWLDPTMPWFNQHHLRSGLTIYNNKERHWKVALVSECTETPTKWGKRMARWSAYTLG